MNAGLGVVESKLADLLTVHLQKQLGDGARIAARSLAIIVSRQYQLPKDELIAVLEYYFVGEEKQMLAGAIDALLRLNLLTTKQDFGEEYIQLDEHWNTTLKISLPESTTNDEILKDVINFRKHRELSLIGSVGSAGQVVSRHALRQAIKRARRRIRLGSYSTKTLFPEVSDVVKEALINNAEMRVEILMFSPRLASEIEDDPNLARDVEDRTKDWQNLYAEARKEATKRGHKPKLEIRWIEDKEMTAFQRGALIDDRQWILNIHHPGFERGVDGVVYQGFCENSSTNIFDLMNYYWEAAWKQARNPHPTLSEYLRRGMATHQNIIYGLILGFISWALAYAKLDPWPVFLQGAAFAKITDDLPVILDDLGWMLEKMGEGLRNFVRSKKK
jgi:hypothetical protein